MRVYSLALIIACVCMILLVPGGSAHHSAAEYDRTKSITMPATVVEFHYANPHPLLFVDGKESNGNVVRWTIEIGPNPAELLRMGWDKKRSEAALAAGAMITVTVTPSKMNPSVGIATKIITGDGEQVFGGAIRLQN